MYTPNKDKYETFAEDIDTFGPVKSFIVKLLGKKIISVDQVYDGNRRIMNICTIEIRKFMWKYYVIKIDYTIEEKFRFNLGSKIKQVGRDEI